MCGDDDIDDYGMVDGQEDSLLTIPSNLINETLVEKIEEQGDSDANVMKILVATDIHVGFGENKANRYLDSINTFEEVLKIATQKQVDMVLLGGDLFHENNPSRDMQHRVVQLLRQYCLSDREVALEFLSDASTNFSHSRFGRVNYEDCNLNVGLPIFTIHGNHDDMAGKGLTALDLLHESGLVNLFGKFEDVDQYEVTPILLRKGSTRVALFGIGSQRDDRLCRAFAEKCLSCEVFRAIYIYIYFRFGVIYAGPWASLQPINGRRMGAKFDDRVANAADMIVTKTISGEKKAKKNASSLLNDPLGTISAASLDQVISQYFDGKPWEERLTVLTHGAIGEAVETFAEDDSVSATKANQEFKLAMEIVILS
uniref:Mre11_DNA_bind domain-containing protein n=1 Tax=Heterorhabditis bacteriophora TaxID=37862 RepID=A0A1I7WIV9_HETBA